MNSPFSDELISAYLDGELTAQEQAYVEEQLRENAELRRMCDQLRALRFTLQSMPTANVPEGLAERVLRQAERRMLLGEEPLSEEAASATNAAPPVKQTDKNLPVPVSSASHPWRMVVGALVTAAALLLVATMLWNPIDSAPMSSEVAHTATDDEATELDTATPGPVAEEEFEEELDADTGMDEQRYSQPNTLAAPSALANSKGQPQDKEREKEPSRLDGTLKVMKSESVDGFGDSEPGAGDTATDGSASRSRGGRPPAPSGGMRGAREAGRPNEGESGGGMGGMGGGGATGADLAGGPGADAPAQPFEEAGDGPAESARRAIAADPARDKMYRATQDVSRPQLARELAQQLETSESLLVSVSVPQNLQSSLYRLADVPTQDASVQLNEAAGQVLELQSGAKVALLDEMTDTRSYYFGIAPSVRNVIVVEGSREELRESLKKLALRTDIAVTGVSASNLATVDPKSILRSRARPLGLLDDSLDDKQRASGQPQTAKNQPEMGPGDREKLRMAQESEGQPGSNQYGGYAGSSEYGEEGGYGAKEGDYGYGTGGYGSPAKAKSSELNQKRRKMGREAKSVDEQAVVADGAVKSKQDQPDGAVAGKAMAKSSTKLDPKSPRQPVSAPARGFKKSEDLSKWYGSESARGVTARQRKQAEATEPSATIPGAPGSSAQPVAIVHLLFRVKSPATAADTADASEEPVEAGKVD